MNEIATELTYAYLVDQGLIGYRNDNTPSKLEQTKNLSDMLPNQTISAFVMESSNAVAPMELASVPKNQDMDVSNYSAFPDSRNPSALNKINDKNSSGLGGITPTNLTIDEKEQVIKDTLRDKFEGLENRQ